MIVIGTPYGRLRIDEDRWVEAEILLMRVGKCPWVTGYGLPWMTYCEEPGRPFCEEHERDEREALRGLPVAYERGTR